MTYPDAQAFFADADAKIERAKGILASAVPVVEGDPAWLYLVKTRRLPEAAVRAALGELRHVTPIIKGRPPQDHAVMSLLRGRDGEVSGFQLTFCDVLGAATGEDPRRQTYSLRPNGCRDGLFHAGGGKGEGCYLVEGYLEKPIAVASLGVGGQAYGYGGRPLLGFAVPVERDVVVVPDRRPDDTVVDLRTGKSEADRHDADQRRGVDCLLLAGKGVSIAAAPDCAHAGCKDADAYLIEHQELALIRLLRQVTPGELSDDGWKRKLAGMDGAEYDRHRKEFAEALGVRLKTLDAMRQADADGDEPDARSRLLAIAIEGELFPDDVGEAYAAVRVGGGVRTFKVDGGAFTDWLLAEYGSRYPVRVGEREVPGSVGAATLADALRTVQATARTAPVRPVFLRVGWTEDTLYVDMATLEPSAIEITARGWRIIPDPPVHLVYSRTAQQLPVPVPGDRQQIRDELAGFFGFKTDDIRFRLLLGVSMATLMPIGPYPIVVITGEQGAGKSARARCVRTTIDPTKAPLRGRPKSAEDLAISVWRSWISCFDNLSKLDQEMSDWLCRLSEGAGLSKRRLYTDAEEVTIAAARLIVITAIPDVARSVDLIDRAVLIRCDPLNKRLSERVFQKRFDEFAPRLLWMLIEGAACALGRLDSVAEVQSGMRRVDFVRWVEAAAPALGLEGGEFSKAYATNQDEGARMALEVDPVASTLMGYVHERGDVEVTASVLLAALEPTARKQHGGSLPPGWPALAHHFSTRLRRLAPSLRKVGCEVVQKRTKAGGLVSVTLDPDKFVRAAGALASEELVSSASSASSRSKKSRGTANSRKYAKRGDDKREFTENRSTPPFSGKSGENTGASPFSETFSETRGEPPFSGNGEAGNDAGDANDAQFPKASAPDARARSLTCSECGAEFSRPARGRPPKRCPSCASGAKERQDPASGAVPATDTIIGADGEIRGVFE